MNQEEFFLAHQVDGKLSDEHMGQMLNLNPEGDTGQPEGSGPDAALKQPVPAAAVEVEKVAAEPGPAIILAKDGVHTIPYEKLAEARENERVAKERADLLQQELEALKKAPATPAAATGAPTDPAAATTTDGEDGTFGDYSEAALKKGVEKLVAVQTAAIKADLEARFATAMEPLQKQQAIAATETHYSTIYKAHPNADAIAESKELADWIQLQPSYARPAMQNVLNAGSASEVVELFDAFTAATGKPAAGLGKPDPAAAAQAAIAKAQTATPTSLSEISAGSSAHHDEAAAMLDMSSVGMMNKFEGKTREQIEALMSKVL